MLRGLYLTLLMGPTIAVPVPQPVIDALMSAQVTTAAGQASGFQLTFALSKKSLLNNLLIPAGLFNAGIRVILMVTVNSLPTVIMDGIITQHTVTPSSEPGQSTLSVTGQDLSVLMDFDATPCIEWDVLPVGAIAGLILTQYLTSGMIPLVIPPIFEEVSLPSEGYNIQTQSDLAFINDLAREAGYVFYIEPGPLPGVSLAYFGPEIRIGIPQPALNINMDADTNVESISFTFDGLAKTDYGITILDPIFEQFPIPISIPAVSLLRPPLVLRPAAALKKARLPETADLDPVRALMKGLAASVTPDPVTASGQLDVLRYGRPLKARQLVGVRGSGLAYDGLYYVTSVTHNIKRGEYKQSFSLAREGQIPLTPLVVP